MHITIGYDDHGWHQERLSNGDFSAPYEELHYFLHNYSHIEWKHVHIRKDPFKVSCWTAIMERTDYYGEHRDGIR